MDHVKDHSFFTNIRLYCTKKCLQGSKLRKRWDAPVIEILGGGRWRTQQIKN